METTNQQGMQQGHQIGTLAHGVTREQSDMVHIPPLQNVPGHPRQNQSIFGHVIPPPQPPLHLYQPPLPSPGSGRGGYGHVEYVAPVRPTVTATATSHSRPHSFPHPHPHLHPSLIHDPSNPSIYHAPYAESQAEGSCSSSITAVPITMSGAPSIATTTPRAARASIPASATSASASTSSRDPSFLGSIFKPKQHRRQSSYVPGWDSDDDEEMDRATATHVHGPHTSPHGPTSMGPAMVGVSNAAVGPEGPVFHEKSPWLRKENKKRSQMRKCLCLAVILCFLILGAVLAFCYREQIFTVGHQQPSASLGAGTGGGGAAPKGNVPQTIEAIESLYHVNKTIIQDEGLHKVFYGIDYTPRGSQEPDCKVDLGQVIEDMKVLSQLTNRIRLYGMACQQTETVFKALEYLELSEMQVVVTLWVDHDKNTWEKQQRAFWNLIDHDMNLNGNANKNNNPGSITISRTASKIMGVSVGNEVLFRNEEQKGKTGFVPINLLENYIQEIRQGLAQRASSAATAAAAGANGSRDTTMAALAQHLTQIPVFSSDLGRNAHQIVDSVDWVMSNIHPFFANTAAEDAADWTFSNFKTETVQAAGKKPAIISEVGWPSGPSSASMGSAVPSRENLQTFLDTWVCQANKRNVPYYYFEAFDEPWKSSINPREAQWGIMTVDRKLKVTIPTC